MCNYINSEIMDSTTLFFQVNATFTNQSSSFLNFLPLTATPPSMKVIYSLIGCLGFLLNVLTMLVTAIYKPLRKFPLNVYIFALSSTDCMAAMFLFTTTIFEYNGSPLEYKNPWHTFLCKYWYRKGVLWSFMSSSAYLIIVISVERYIAVVHPLFYKMKFSKKRIYSAAMIGESSCSLKSATKCHN